ncbi:fas-activated serine/threonine kinase [Austrofundulus limnaeus]|uniref:Fas-activated serine/threonine kinase n=1 Tax=Austrofundulus limnaeus TaxID=52670 RepID=A0A2I4D1W4_AUSLI|nr:PREDICTED: fas-activated serine/threonine kinase [Austrofundulus limnaeus]XP_013886246.1 PREDICTED: fas-activated serine/threonine kinase [Austrofundulus limnaeus]
MLCFSAGRSLLSRAHVTMYATRLYSATGGGGGGGGRIKPGRRVGLAVLEAPPSQLPHHPHPVPPPPASYQLYHGRPDPHRGAHFHHYPPPPHHLAPPPLPSHYHTPVHIYEGGGAPVGGGVRKKTWNFIHEKMSYDTFFTMKRLIERSQRPDEVLRWVTQNPAKISHNHYPVALQKIGQLLQATPLCSSGDTCTDRVGDRRQILEHPDFRTLCDAIVNDCDKFDNFSIVNCLYAVAALGLPSDSQVVQVLEAKSQSRLHQFNQKDVSMVFSSSMKLHPGSQHPLTEACLSSLEKNLERERHPQTLFLLLSYYRMKWQPPKPASEAAAGCTSTPVNPEQLLANRKILRLVKHTLASISGARDQEMVLLDEMLSVCAREAGNKSLELIFSSHLFYQNRQERFISSLTEELPKKVDSITPYTMALIAKYIARHRLRETRLLDTIADFLVKKAEYLDSKVIQKLVLPFSRMSYRPSSEDFFTRLEEVVEMKALRSPLATVNILMSLFQLGHFPKTVLHSVFSSAFISNVINSPHALIVRRYLTLLDVAIELEYRDYTGPRLPDVHKVLMFEHALTADDVNRKQSYKGLVAEALRQLVGEQNYKQGEVLAPGYYTDFVLWLDGSGRVLPIRSGAGLPLSVAPSSCVAVETEPDEDAVAVVTSELQKLSPFSVLEDGSEQSGLSTGLSTGQGDEGLGGTHMCCSTSAAAASGPVRTRTNDVGLDYEPYYGPAPEYYSGLAKEQSVESQDSSTLSSSPSDGPALLGALGPAGAVAPDSLFQFSFGKILEDEGTAGDSRVQEPDHELSGFYEGSSADRGPQEPTQLHPPDRAEPETLLTKSRQIHRVIMSVNDKWHYCHNSEVLVGSRAMRDRHLRLLGYIILQLPYHELQKLNGIEEMKQYLHQKLLEVPL